MPASSTATPSWPARLGVGNVFLVVALATGQFYLTSGYRPYPDPGPDIVGGFCTTRRGEQCCPGRDDFCTVPILDVVCYCDAFCNRTISDCCPDFWSHCLGVEPPPGARTDPPPTLKNRCVRNGVYHQPADVLKDNCNNCTCVAHPSGTHYDWHCSNDVCLIREEIIGHVNDDLSRGWRASNYSFLWGMSLKDGVRYRLGTFHPVDPVKRMTSLRVHVNELLPDSFDARQEWPNKIHPVMDQGNCGASWAFSTTSVAADRLTLHSNGHFKDMLSPQNLVSCDRDYRQKGCEGGHIDRAWWYMRKVGVVTDECYPYVSGSNNQPGVCQVAQKSGNRVDCPGRPGSRSRIFKTTPPYRIAAVEREIMYEIMVNGPVQATVEVKEDFYMYQGGVYSYSRPAVSQGPNKPTTGFHSVRIIGWGVDQYGPRPQKYWLCVNSWGPRWGENGYFRIVRGEDECKIESFVVGVWAKVDGRQVVKTRRRNAELPGFSLSSRSLTARAREGRGRRHGERNRKNRHRKRNSATNS